MYFKAGLLATAAIVALSSSAFAAPITFGSQLNINGFDRPIGAATIDASTGLDFTDGSGTSPGVAGVIGAVSGSGTFAALSCNSACGTIEDIPDFATFTGIDSFYVTDSGVAFDLDDITSITRVAASTGQLPTLIVSGTGTFSFAGFDDTPGTFTLTSQGDSLTTFSASTVAQAVDVPEPVTLGLLGLGLLGLGAASLRRKAD